MGVDGSGQTRLTDNGGGDFQPAFSPDGRTIAFVSTRDGQGEIYTMNADGSGQANRTNSPGEDFAPAFSPDGRIAFWSNRDGNLDIYVMSGDGTGLARLTSDPGADVDPAFSPDGRKIAFVRNSQIYVMNADGSGQTRLTTSPLIYTAQPNFSPDGARIVFAGNFQIYVMGSDGSNPTRLTDSGFNAAPAFSPDGREIAFQTDRGGNLEINMIAPDGSHPEYGLTRNPASDLDPDWGVRPAAPPPAPPGAQAPAGAGAPAPGPAPGTGASRCGDAARPRSSLSKRSRLTRTRILLSGRATDRECSPNGRAVRSEQKLARVEVSVAVRAGKKCRFLTAKGTLSGPRSCARPLWLKTNTVSFDAKKANTAWKYARAVKLPAGRYSVVVRGVDRDGNLEAKKRSSNRAMLRFK